MSTWFSSAFVGQLLAGSRLGDGRGREHRAKWVRYSEVVKGAVLEQPRLMF